MKDVLGQVSKAALHHVTSLQMQPAFKLVVLAMRMLKTSAVWQRKLKQMYNFVQNRKIVLHVWVLFFLMATALASGLPLERFAKVDAAWMDVVILHALKVNLLLMLVELV
jgi:hypothetical protein